MPDTEMDEYGNKQDGFISTGPWPISFSGKASQGDKLPNGFGLETSRNRNVQLATGTV